MKIKQTILALVLLMGSFSVFLCPVAMAAKCGGVETSVLDCESLGGGKIETCPGGEDPYYGGRPANGYEYFVANGHYYGFCDGGASPIITDVGTDKVSGTGIYVLLITVINILSAGIGVVAVGGIVYGSILYASAGGGPENIKKAKTIITDIVIGLVAYALMYAFLNFIIPGGLFA